MKTDMNFYPDQILLFVLVKVITQVNILTQTTENHL